MRVNRRKDGKTKETVAGGRPGREILFGPIYLDHEFVLALGIRPRTLGCAEQAFPRSLHDDQGRERLGAILYVYRLFLDALPAGAFMKRYGYRKGIIMGLLLFAIGAFGFIPAAFLHSATPFLIALFVIACGLCILETAANPYSTILGPSASAAQRLNLSQSFKWIRLDIGAIGRCLVDIRGIGGRFDGVD